MNLEFIDRDGQTIAFPSHRFWMGASKSCELRFPTLQPRHLEVSKDSHGQWRMKDISGTGTLEVDGVSSLEALISPGSKVVVGALQLRVRKVQPAGDRTEAAPAFVPGRLEEGTVLGGRYKILDWIAEGGMGEVYRAEHTALGKAFAIKVMRPDLSTDEDFVMRFKREAIAASRIGHRHIVSVADFGHTTSGRLFIAMEFLVGSTLHALLEQGPMQTGRVRRIGLQIAQALNAAHQVGVLHRDLKPENVMLLQRPDQPDFVKVLDFGAAKDVTDTEATRQTAQGMVVGTPAYMSPEQAAGLPVDARTDVYALGVILYELLTGKQAFDALTPSGVLNAHLRGELPPLPPIEDDELSEIVMRMVARRQHHRPMSMDAVIAVLEEMPSTVIG